MCDKLKHKLIYIYISFRLYQKEGEMVLKIDVLPISFIVIAFVISLGCALFIALKICKNKNPSDFCNIIKIVFLTIGFFVVFFLLMYFLFPSMFV